MPRKQITTPRQLWQGFDPRKDPLEIVTIRRWKQGASDMHAFYFTSHTFEGEKARIYAIYGVPVGTAKTAKLPAVLHIHGGGQTATAAWLTYWNKRRYAAMTFNWGGLWDQRSRTALWGDRMHHCNHKYAAGKLMAMRPTPRECSWYHWAVASRRALTALERQKQVDAKRLGIFGISMGGTLVWNVAGTDARVKAACAIYGAGWNTYPPTRHEPDPGSRNRDTVLWRKTMAPETYAPLIRCPVLFLSGSNDFHGKLDFAYDTLAAVPGTAAAAFTPHYSHHVAAPQGKSLPILMDTFLKGQGAWPENPHAELTLDDAGVGTLTVHPDLSQPVARVEIHHGLEDANPKTRHWRTLHPRKQGGGWSAALPVANTRKRLFAFAQVYYRTGLCLASNLLDVIPAALGRARATDTPSLQLSDFSRDCDDFATTCVSTDPCYTPGGVVRVKGPDRRWGIRSVTGAAIITRKPGDPKWRGPDRATLAFDVLVPEAVELKILLKHHEGASDQRVYEVKLPLTARKTWQPIRLKAGRFRDDKGRPLKRWTSIEMIEIAMTSLPKPRPVYTHFRWIPA